MSENENPDHLELMRLLQEAKPLTETLFPDQQKKWAAGSPLAQEISAILAVNQFPSITTKSAHTSAKFLPTQTLKCG